MDYFIDGFAAVSDEVMSRTVNTMIKGEMNMGMGKLDWQSGAVHSPVYRREHKRLKRFLRSKGILNKFRRAVRRARGYSMQNLSWPTISGAFIWCEATEGHKYWDEVDTEWRKHRGLLKEYE